ncbi:MAG: PAS domain S-box protein [Desulfobacterales bacterium]|jgi:two-component system NtrC family sensor kinase|nr:PAS domain S-box protein [Desulfobacterales bacterium]
MDKKIQIASAILEAIEDGIYVVGREFKLEYMNSAMIRELGNGVGKNCFEVIHRLREKCPWCLAQEVFDGKTQRREVRFPATNKYYDIIDVPLKSPDGGSVSMLSICRDITLRKQSQARLRASEKDYEYLFENVGCGVYISNKEGKVLNANRALIEMLGYESKEEFSKIDIATDLYLRPADRVKFQEMVERDGRVIDYEAEFKRKDKRPLTVLLTSHVRLNSQGEIVGYEGIIVDQSQRKLMEEKLRASEEDFKRLFELVECGVFISSKDGRFIKVNKALLDMLGYSSEAEFLTLDIARDLYVRPEDRKRFQEAIARDGRVVSQEVEFRKKDGGTVSVLLTGHARYDQKGIIIGYEGLNVDITQRKLMEKELKEAYDFINKIIKSSPNPIIAADMKGSIMIWNPAAEETLGYRAEEVIGKINIQDIYPDDMAFKVMKMMRGPDYGGVGKLRAYPMIFLKKDGTGVEGNLSAAILYDAGGKEVASVGSFVDLEERLEMERALQRTQAQLLQAEKLAAMGRLTSQIAHELNNPLYGIMNTLELMKTEIPPENRRRKILEMALSETMRLSDLLKKMLSFSKPDQEEKAVVNINMLLDEILSLHGKQLLENNIRISAALSEDLPNIFASRNQLRQVFINLIKNAMDAMPEGGELRVRTGSDAGRVRVDVSDNGIGIQKAHLGKIFDSFFTTKDSVKGVGLGLSVCYGFIKDHGGDIRVESKPGAGTTFIITLPCHDD